MIFINPVKQWRLFEGSSSCWSVNNLRNKSCNLITLYILLIRLVCLEWKKLPWNDGEGARKSNTYWLCVMPKGSKWHLWHLHFFTNYDTKSNYSPSV